MDAAVFVTFPRITPVEHEYSAVRTVSKFHPTEPRIGGYGIVGGMFDDVDGTGAFHGCLIGSVTMKIQREEPSAVLRGPDVALLHHHPDVRVATAQVVRRAVS